MEDKIIKVPCKKCKAKESINYTTRFIGEEVEIEIESCNKCGHEVGFEYIIKYL